MTSPTKPTILNPITGGTAEVIVSKHRNGPTGKISLAVLSGGVVKELTEPNETPHSAAS